MQVMRTILTVVRVNDILIVDYQRLSATINMVCAKCEKKQTKVAAPDPFRNKSLGASASTSKQTDERNDLGKNKLLSKNRYLPYAAKTGGSKCKVCKQTTARPDAKYCQNCAYKRGKCSVCGVKQM
ncbi:hypothetical protein WALSEDRAFT_63965 [Wallemia mellicola CBS 633.66]|nr:hypothetical protein WALSEDRAFT_63965 [Wallemia mellicola CBS 633.66]EIM21732.1 hypothetical protein WALSEDRAFT_63965 [Wallemia mellicola CBS 633.66]|eukprot:XP_006958043.1 hypothetical protein WALSEDRAFT_63965 [Wallemia mellicola CBS 633.66]